MKCSWLSFCAFLTLNSDFAGVWRRETMHLFLASGGQICAFCRFLKMWHELRQGLLLAEYWRFVCLLGYISMYITWWSIIATCGYDSNHLATFCLCRWFWWYFLPRNFDCLNFVGIKRIIFALTIYKQWKRISLTSILLYISDSHYKLIKKNHIKDSINHSDNEWVR